MVGVTVVGVVAAGVVAEVAELPDELVAEEPVDAVDPELVVAAGLEVDVDVAALAPYWWPTKTTRPPVATTALMAVKVVAVRIRCAPTARGCERGDMRCSLWCPSIVTDDPKGRTSRI